jgi:hypothetical protein
MLIEVTDCAAASKTWDCSIGSSKLQREALFDTFNKDKEKATHNDLMFCVKKIGGVTKE